MSIRILHIVGDSKFGGASLGILRLAQYWRSLGWEVELLATDPTFVEAARQAGITVNSIPVVWREIRPLRDLAGLIRLWLFLRSHRFTVVHTHTTKAGFIGRLAARWARIPIIVHTSHGFAFHEASTKTKIAFYCVLDRIASYCCDRVVAVSWFHQKWGRRLGMAARRKWRAIPNGIPRPPEISTEQAAQVRAGWGAGPETTVLLTHGRLVREKGLEDIIRAARLLKDSFSRPFVFVLAGEGALRRDLEQMAGSLGVQDLVRFTGFQRDIPAMLAAADIVVLPSLREGLSVALLEAMSMGRPIIATTIGSNIEATRRGAGALLIPTATPDAIAAAVRQLALNPEEAKRLGRSGNDIYSKNYTLEQMLAGYHRLYLELLAAHGVAGTASFHEENQVAHRVPALLPSIDR